jgi:hypothetical protein
MDEFNHGIYHPEAIRDFLIHAYRAWDRAPGFVVLAGEGNYDYLNRQGHGDNLVPPLMVGTPWGLFPTDNRYADVAGDDGVPEMAIGRLPVVTPSELEALTAKIAAYESDLRYRDRNVLFLADNPDEAGDFPSDSDALAATLPPETPTDRISLSDQTLAGARQMLFEGIDSGVFLLNYIGHGGVDRLADEGLFLVSDVAALANDDRLPILTAMSCMVGQFGLPGYDGLSESLVLRQGGGAIAVWAATGMSVNDQALPLDRQFINDLLASEIPTIGEIVVNTVAAEGGGLSRYMLDIYNLQGDPALRVR